MTKQRFFKPPRSLLREFPQVKRVLHAKKPVRVEVTQRDCDAGKKLKTSECALAKATKRQFHADGVAIRLSDSYIVKGTTAVRFSTPISVAREIVSFDRHKDFAAGTYNLAPAKPGWARPGKRHSPDTKPGRKDKTNKVVHRTVRVRTVNSEERQG